MKRTHKWIAGLLATGMAATLTFSTRATASPEGTRNTAIAATAVAGYLTYKYAQKPSSGRLVPAVAAAGAAGYAWHQSGRSAKEQAEREKAEAYRAGRRDSHRSSYRGNAKHKHNASCKKYKKHCRR